LIVFHHESESGAWLISTYLPAAWAVPVANSATSAKIFSKDRLLDNVIIASQVVVLEGTRRRSLGSRTASVVARNH
jgi:hypothetical protein